MDHDEKSSFEVVRVLDDGQEVFIANRKDLNRAEELVVGLMECWPGDYWIKGPGLIKRKVIPLKKRRSLSKSRFGE